MSLSQPSGADLPDPFRRSLRAHWGQFMAEGVLLTLLGLAAFLLPFMAGLVATALLGWVFLLAGIAGLVSTLQARQAPGFGWSLLSALLAVLAGIILLWNPLEGLVTLTLVLTAFFFADGVLMIILAIAHRRELSGRWEWMLLNGILDLILAVIVLFGVPGTLFWVIGLLVGIDMLFGGAALIAMALEARKPIVG